MVAIATVRRHQSCSHRDLLCPRITAGLSYSARLRLNNSMGNTVSLPKLSYRTYKVSHLQGATTNILYCYRSVYTWRQGALREPIDPYRRRIPRSSEFSSSVNAKTFTVLRSYFPGWQILTTARARSYLSVKPICHTMNGY
jgi:hypothetical protein